MTAEAPILPRALVEVTPEQLLFKLAPNTQPGCVLDFRNASDATIAFKVKTTEPRRYLVRPNQGLVRAGATEMVNVYLIEKECNELLQTPLQTSKTGDKFLVQTTAVGDEYYAMHGTLSSTQQAEQLTDMWSKVEKGAVRNKKLSVRLIYPTATSTGFAPGTPRTPSKHSAYTSPAPNSSMPATGGRYSGMDGGRGDPGRSGESSTLDEDPRELDSKYDDLVNYMANLTEERDELNQSLEEAKKELQREMAARIALESKGQHTRQVYNPRPSAGVRPAANAHGGGGGFGWFTLAVVAVTFFMLGQWL